MSLPVEITAVQAVINLKQTAAGPQRILSIRLSFSDGRESWGDCVAARVSYDPHFLSQQLLETVGPAIIGRPLRPINAILAEVDVLQHHIIVQEPVPIDEQAGEVASQSRRQLFSVFRGRPEGTTENQQLRDVTVAQAIDPALRYGLSQALYAATIEPPTHLAATLWPFELLARIDDIAHRLLLPQVQLAGRFFSATKPKEQFGEKAEKLQAYVRQVGKWLTESHQLYQCDHPSIVYLDVNGGLGKIYQGNLGRVLGALYGLEQSVKPHQLYVVDPILIDDLTIHLKKLKELKSYFAFRRLKVQLVASGHAKDPDSIQSLAEIADIVQLTAADLGGWDKITAAAQHIKAAGKRLAIRPSYFETERSSRLAITWAFHHHPDIFAPCFGAEAITRIDSFAQQAQLTTK